MLKQPNQDRLLLGYGVQRRGSGAGDRSSTSESHSKWLRATHGTQGQEAMAMVRHHSTQLWPHVAKDKNSSEDGAGQDQGGAAWAVGQEALALPCWGAAPLSLPEPGQPLPHSQHPASSPV